MEANESIKEQKNKRAIAIGSKWNNGRCGNCGLVGYSTLSLAKDRPGDISLGLASNKVLSELDKL